MVETFLSAGHAGPKIIMQCDAMFEAIIAQTAWECVQGLDP
jgi:hypothetical protein